MNFKVHFDNKSRLDGFKSLLLTVLKRWNNLFKRIFTVVVYNSKNFLKVNITSKCQE
jgi:hypothetical protein